jgi:hypothetical protein
MNLVSSSETLFTPYLRFAANSQHVLASVYTVCCCLVIEMGGGLLGTCSFVLLIIGGELQGPFIPHVGNRNLFVCVRLCVRIQLSSD